MNTIIQHSRVAQLHTIGEKVPISVRISNKNKIYFCLSTFVIRQSYFELGVYEEKSFNSSTKLT